MKKQTFAWAALAVALAGCAGTSGSEKSAGSLAESSPTPKFAGQTQPRESRDAAACHSTRCQIRVEVRNCVVTVTPYFVVMTNPGPVTMVWQIEGNATFADGGIRWKEPRAAAGVFEPSKEGTEKTAVMINKRNAFSMFHYGVTVKEEGGKICPVLDPTIINDWP